ncbi:MAG TPA: rhombosortase [Steroidobacteraceae bacterium]|nr:rhombosortase [Steroidobacteraceae bacterium]
MTPSNPVDGFRRLLRSLNCDGPYGAALGFACLALLATEPGGDAARHALRYQRDALATGQWWRLVTAHFVHLSLHHALLNTLALVLLWMLFARDYSPRAWLLIVAGAMAAIDFGLWVGDSTVLWYVGSSGALHGVLAAGTLAHLRRHEPDAWILALLLVGKIAYEQSIGPLPLMPRGTVVVDAHLYGALGALLAARALTAPTALIRRAGSKPV